MSTHNKQSFQLDKDGNIVASLHYPAIPVEIKDGEIPTIIGEQHAYVISNTVDKARVPQLRAFLQRQVDFLNGKVKDFDKIIAKYEHLDVSKLNSAFVTLPVDKLQKSKKLQALNQLVTDVYTKKQAEDQRTFFSDQLPKYKEQLDFIDAHFK